MSWVLGTGLAVDECRRDQRRLQTLTLPVNCVRFRDKAVGVYRLCMGTCMGRQRVGRNILFGVDFGLKTRVTV